MSHIWYLLTNPKKCKNNAAGCHPQKSDCHNNVGGFECKCKNYKYEYGDGYDCFEDLSLVLFSSNEPQSSEEEFMFAKKLTIRIRLSHVI